MVRKKKENNDVVRFINEIVVKLSEIPSFHLLEQVEKLKCLDLLWSAIDNKATENHVIAVVVAAVARYNCGKDVGKLLAEESKFDIIFDNVIKIFKKSSIDWNVKSMLVQYLSLLLIYLRIPTVKNKIRLMTSVLSWNQLDNKDKLLKKYTLENEYKAKSEEINDPALTWIPEIFQLFVSSIDEESEAFIGYSLSVLNLIILLLSQLPTRRMYKTVIEQLNLVLLGTTKDISSFEYGWLLKIADIYLNFPVDEFSGELIDYSSLTLSYTNHISKLQKILFRDYKTIANDLVFANFEYLQDHDNLSRFFNELNPEQIDSLFEELEISSSNLSEKKIHAFINFATPTSSIEDIFKNLPSLPTEVLLTNFTNLNYQCIPKLGSQYLSLADFVFRCYLISLFGSYTELSKHLISTVSRFKLTGEKLVGSSRHAQSVHNLKIEEKESLDFTSTFKDLIVDININLNNLDSKSIDEWNSLDSDDVLMLVQAGDKQGDTEFSKAGINKLRCGIILEKLTNNKSKLTTAAKSFILRVKLDSQIFHDCGDSVDDYQGFNLAIKPPVQLTKFNDLLLKIKEVNKHDEALPAWFLDLFLGYGNTKIEELVSDNLSESEEEEEVATKKRKLQHGSVTLESTVAGLSVVQSEIYKKLLTRKLSLVDAPSFTGKKLVLTKLLSELNQQSSERTLLLVKNESTIPDIRNYFTDAGFNDEQLFNLSLLNSDNNLIILKLFEKLQSHLKKVDELSGILKLEGSYGDDVETAILFNKYVVEKKYKEFSNQVEKLDDLKEVIELYPFNGFEGEIEIKSKGTKLKLVTEISKHYSKIRNMFQQIEKLQPLAILKSVQQQNLYLLKTQAKIIIMSEEKYNFDFLKDVKYDNLILYNANQFTELESVYPLVTASTYLKRVILFGDSNNLKPVKFSSEIDELSGLNISLFQRLLNMGVESFGLTEQFGINEGIHALLAQHYRDLTLSQPLKTHNPGLIDNVSFVTVSGEESQPIPYFYQNLHEAEFAVHLYIFLVMSCSYPNDKVGIITFDQGQQILLQEVADARCTEFELETPYISTLKECTRDSFNILILSLVRSSDFDNFTLGESLPIAVSKAKTGIYMLSSPPLQKHLQTDDNPFTSKALQLYKPKSLELILGEVYGDDSKRKDAKSHRRVVKSWTQLHELLKELKTAKP